MKKKLILQTTIVTKKYKVNLGNGITGHQTVTQVDGQEPSYSNTYTKKGVLDWSGKQERIYYLLNDPDYVDLYPDVYYQRKPELSDPALEIENIPDIENTDVNRLYALTLGGDGLMWKITQDAPLTMDFHYDYMSGYLRSTNCKLDECLVHLMSHPWVKSAEFSDVPYYSGGGKAIHYVVRPPQEVIDDTWKNLHLKANARDYPSSLLIDSFSAKGQWYGLDPLGLKPFLFEEKEETESEEDGW